MYTILVRAGACICGCLYMRAYVYELKIVSPDKCWRQTRIIIVTTTTRVIARRIARTAPLAWGKREMDRSVLTSPEKVAQMWIAQLVERPTENARRNTDAGSSPRCGKRFFLSQSQFPVQTLSGVRTAPVCSHMHQHLRDWIIWER